MTTACRMINMAFVLIVSHDLLGDQMNKHLFEVTFCRQLKVNRRKPLSGIKHECSLLKKVDRQLEEEKHLSTGCRFLLLERW